MFTSARLAESTSHFQPPSTVRQMHRNQASHETKSLGYSVQGGQGVLSLRGAPVPQKGFTRLAPRLSTTAKPSNEHAGLPAHI